MRLAQWERGLLVHPIQHPEMKVYLWFYEWHKSDVDAIDGLIVRRSTNRKWVTAIAWERFLSAQGHNPWECMHLSVNVGPLKQGKTRTVRGEIYLFEGSQKDALERYKEDFASGPGKYQ